MYILSDLLSLCELPLPSVSLITTDFEISDILFSMAGISIKEKMFKFMSTCKCICPLCVSRRVFCLCVARNPRPCPCSVWRASFSAGPLFRTAHIAEKKPIRTIPPLIFGDRPFSSVSCCRIQGFGIQYREGGFQPSATGVRTAQADPPY